MVESNEKLIFAIKHYQDSLERHTKTGNSQKLLHAIEKLARLPIRVCHLEETGVGRTVNGLKRFEGEVGDNARTLVDKWKSMVKGEEDSQENLEPAKEIESVENEVAEEDPEALHIDPEKNNEDGKQPTSELKNSSHKKSSSSHKNSHSSSSSRHSYNDKSEDKSISYDSEDKKSKRHNSSENSDSTGSETSHRAKKRKSDKKGKHSSNSSKPRRYSDGDSESDSESEESDSSKSSDSESSSSEDPDSDEDTRNYKSKQQVSTDRKHKKHQSSSSEDDSKKNSNKHSNHKSQEKHRSRKNSNSESEQESKNKHDKSKDKYVPSGKSKDKSKDSSDRSKEKAEKRNMEKESESKSKSNKDKSKSSDSEKHSHKSSSKSEEKRKDDSKRSSSKSHSENKKADDKKRHREPSAERDVKRHKGNDGESSKKKSREQAVSNKHQEKRSSDKKREDRKDNKKNKSEKPKKSSSESSSSKSPKEKEKHKPVTPMSSNNTPKIQSRTKLLVGIDSQSGIGFADVLGMLEVPVYSKKKKVSGVEEKPKDERNSSSSREVKSSSNSKDDKEKSSMNRSNNDPSTSLSDNTEVPKLLKDLGELEPLDINLSNLLPPITPNYRPLSAPLDGQNRKIWTDDEALSHVISAKHQRTKVYSGNKSGYTKVPTLFDLCSRILQDNLDALEYTGGVPYSILKHILEKANPDQLYQMEFHNPYLIEDTDELWQLHCQKEFRNKKRDELESWREMYMRCLDEREAKLKALTANIKQSQDKCLPVRTTKLAYVDSVVKPPRNIARKQAKNGTAVDIKRPLHTPAERLSLLAKSGEAAKVAVPNPGRATTEKSSSSTSHSSHLKPKKAPLMAKTLSLLKNRFGRR